MISFSAFALSATTKVTRYFGVRALNFVQVLLFLTLTEETRDLVLRMARNCLMSLTCFGYRGKG